MFEVTLSVTGKDSLKGEQVDITYYKGDSLAAAISAQVMAAAETERKDAWYTVNSITLTV